MAWMGGPGMDRMVILATGSRVAPPKGEENDGSRLRLVGRRAALNSLLLRGTGASFFTCESERAPSGSAPCRERTGVRSANAVA